MLIAYERAARGWRVFGGWGVRARNQSLCALPEGGGLTGIAAPFFARAWGLSRAWDRESWGILRWGVKALNELDPDWLRGPRAWFCRYNGLRLRETGIGSLFAGKQLMAVTWYKRVQILPGFAIIFSSRGMSFALGKRGSSITVGTPGKWSKGLFSGILNRLKQVFMGGRK